MWFLWLMIAVPISAIITIGFSIWFFIAGGEFDTLASYSFLISAAIFVTLSLILIGICLADSDKKEREQKQKERIVQREEEIKGRKFIQKIKENTQKDLAHKVGLDKILELENREYHRRQANIPKASMAMRELGSLMEKSVYQEAEHDWAILGGFAQGIAGPGAGAAAAMGAIQDNVRIRKENEERKAWGREMNRSFNKLADQTIASQFQSKEPSLNEIKKKYRVIFTRKKEALFQCH